MLSYEWLLVKRNGWRFALVPKVFFEFKKVRLILSKNFIRKSIEITIRNIWKKSLITALVALKLKPYFITEALVQFVRTFRKFAHFLFFSFVFSSSVSYTYICLRWIRLCLQSERTHWTNKRKRILFKDLLCIRVFRSFREREKKVINGSTNNSKRCS
jgi:hypothetical protein